MLENLQCDYPCETKERENALWFSVYFYFLFHFGLLEE